MRNIPFRQGDLTFVKIDEVVSGTPQKELTVELGEITGHKHLLVCGVNSKVIGDKTKFTLTGKAKLVHEEHGTIDFDAGTYLVLRKQEFDPIDEQMRQVVD